MTVPMGTVDRHRNQKLLVKALEVNGTPVGGGDPAAHIADASTAHALNSTFSDTEVETALNALGTKINAVLDALENANIVASA